MASSVVIRTTPITREKLARALGANHELVKLLENLVSDVTVNIPTATDTLQVATEDNSAQINITRATADEALSAAMHPLEGPPVPVLVIQDIPDDLTGRIAALEARLADAFLLIAELKEGPTA